MSVVQSRLGQRLTLEGLFKKLGPGVITGAADDDPSGIATYSQAGAQMGFGLLWTVVLTWPLMVAVQSISARIGRVTGRGLAGNMVLVFPRSVVTGLVLLLFIANTINLGADLAAMGAAAKLMLGVGSPHLYTLAFAVFSLLSVVFIPYHRYVGVLKWLTLSLLAYVGVVLTVKIDWQAVVVGAFIPKLELSGDSVTLVVAVFGTTISPYLFFWQSSQEVEEEEADPEAGPLVDRPDQANRELNRIGWETWAGMAMSNGIAFFIILTAAVTLHTAGKTDIQTAEQAAEALRPIAGNAAFFLFSLGLIGTGLLAIPVLAGSVAYAAAEAAHPSKRMGSSRLPLAEATRSVGELAAGVYCTTISTRRFCGSRTPSPVCTSRPCSPRPITEIACAGTPSRTRASFTALARRSDSAML
jgi:NRAMP (natural resistance-associated macrophage protein)-like metal ion transporter